MASQDQAFPLIRREPRRKEHGAHGHHVDAKQARQMIQYLDDIMNVMQIQIRSRQDGGHLLFADTLLQIPDDEGDLS